MGASRRTKPASRRAGSAPVTKVFTVTLQQSAPLLRRRPLAGRRPAGGHDFGEGGGVETGAAHEGAVDVGLRHQLGRVAGLDAAAIDDAAGVGRVAAEEGREPGPDAAMGGVGLVGGGDAAGSDS